MFILDRDRLHGRFLPRTMFVLVLLGLTCAAATAQEAGINGSLAVPHLSEGELTVEALESRVKQIEGSEELEEGTKKELLETYQEALAQLRLSGKYAALIAEFKKEAENAPSRVDAIKSELAEAVAEPKVEIPADASLLQIEQLLAQAEADLTQANQKLAELEGQPRLRADRRVEIPKLTAGAKDRLEEVSRGFAVKPAAEEADPVTTARRILLASRKSSIERELELYEEELKSYDARQELLAVRRDQAARRVTQAEMVVRALQEIVNDRRRSEAERGAQDARRARREAARAHPLLQELAEVNASLAERRTGPEGLASRIERVSLNLEVIEKQRDSISADFSNVQEKVKAGRLTKAVGLLLLRKRGELPEVREHRRNMRRLQSEISEAQFELMELEERRSKLASIEQTPQTIVSKLDPSVSESQREDIEAEARELLESRREYLDALIGDYGTYFGKLVDLEAMERQLIATAEDYADYIDEHILWVQNTSAFHIATFQHARDALRWLINPEGLGSVLRSLWTDSRGKPVLYGAAILLLAALFYGRRRLRDKLERISPLLHKADTDRFSHTLTAFLLTLLMATPWPFLLAFLGWRLASPFEEAELANAIAAGLRVTAALYYALEVIRTICLPAGLGGAHFRMRPEALRPIRRHLRWFMMVVLPAAFVLAAIEWQTNDLWKESLGRVAFIVSSIALSVLFFILLRPSGQVMKAVLMRNRGGWLDRSRYVWYSVALSFPVALAVIAALGYYYTAQELEQCLKLTITLVLAAVFANAMLVRWLLVVRRKLAIRRALARQPGGSGEQEQKEAQDERETPGATAPEPEESLYALSARTRRFLRVVLGVSLLIGLWVVWADVLPALGVMNKVELWSTTMKVTEAVGPEGAETLQTVEKVVPITLAGVALALIVVALAIIAARNVPGLLEIAILRHLPMDRGVRFAITSLSRYLIIVVGVVIAFGRLGVGWSKVQWLIAAMTVGLGFGLQEIFANFVSGLIILFERPMRVGDTVTVGDITGTVTRIRIRATTILDWNRKELVVPNKEFITGRLINWTLSDTILRMDFPVGIAYGSDTALAEKLLFEVARDNQLVLEEPNPIVIFKGFGDSSLEFELRVFIPNMDSYLTVWHQVNRAIDDAFREGSIEIAFPQRDIHVRSVGGTFPIEMKPQEGSRTDE